MNAGSLNGLPSQGTNRGSPQGGQNHRRGRGDASRRPRGGGRGGGGGGGGRGAPGHGSTDQSGGGRGVNGGDRPARGRAQVAATAANLPRPSAALEQARLDVPGPTSNDVTDGEDLDDDGEVCFICAGPVVHESVAPCNHRTCHICSLRMRALYKSKDCAHCRTPAPLVIFTDDRSKRYEHFEDGDISSVDPNIGIRYGSTQIMEDTLIILRYNCPDQSCDVACLGWPDLHRHVKSVHHKKMCDLCSRHKKVFTHEQALFTDKELDRHMKKGDDDPGAVNQSGFRGHPLCAFCGTRFYGDDELYVHCREQHERCFICDRHTSQPQYFVNRNELRAHFRKDHFECPNEDCVQQQFIVFETELDLKAHQLEVHGKELSKDVRRDARMVNLSHFDLRTPFVEPRDRGRNQRDRSGRGGGRGRDPNAEPLPASSAQPLRRDEQAFQRQLAIQSAQTIAPRTFGGQLTASRPANESMTVARPSTGVEATASALDALDLSAADQARQLRHRSVIERAGTLLQNDATKLTQFRHSISSFKNSGLSAGALIDSFFALFSDTSSTALGTLIRELADLYEDPSKGNELRGAWNDWRAINEDYPSLPGPSSLTGSGSARPLNWASTAATGSSTANTVPNVKVKTSRVLKLKSSTAQSSRSAVGGRSVGGSALGNHAFPGLPTANLRGSASTVPSWGTASSSSKPAAQPAKATPSRPQASTASGGPKTDAFPALPKAAKPQSSVSSHGGRLVRRDPAAFGGGGATQSNPWGGGGQDATTRLGGDDKADEVGDEAAKGKGKAKGNRGKKQVIMGWG